MGSITSAFGLVFVILLLMAKTKRNRVENNGNRQSNGSRQNGVRVVNNQARTIKSNAQPVAVNQRKKENVISHSMKDSHFSSFQMEDRNNDWLAKEMKEERRALYRVSEMFQLKTEHSKSCEAELARQFHHDNCSSEGVDTAKGK